MDEMVHHLRDEQSNELDDDFSVNEFLDRFAIRASQIGTILNLVGQMAEVGAARRNSGSGGRRGSGFVRNGPNKRCGSASHA